MYTSESWTILDKHRLKGAVSEIKYLIRVVSKTKRVRSVQEELDLAPLVKTIETP